MAGESWDAREVELVIDTYFSMLELELEGEAFSKTEHRERLQGKIDRSKGSIEYKLQNVSAILAEMGAVFIDGYKPARNAQQLLRTRVAERFGTAAELRQQMLAAVAAPSDSGATALPVEIAPPAVARTGPSSLSRVARKVDYNEREAANRTLGAAGERAVVDLERHRLESIGREDLARKVRHVAEEDGDGLGYDVLSFSAAGDERFIEVKTTRYSPHQPFFVSRNEVAFSADEPERFRLLRLFRFEASQPGFYRLAGSLTKSAHLEVSSYVGWPSGA